MCYVCVYCKPIDVYFTNIYVLLNLSCTDCEIHMKYCSN
jgi:hypothetical protein